MIPENERLLHDTMRTENAQATQFISGYGKNLRYIPEWGSWLTWDGKRWLDDSKSVAVLRKARDHSNRLWHQFSDIARSDADRDELLAARSFVKMMNRKSGIQAVLELARADIRVCVSMEELNQKRRLLNCQNGTVDLATGILSDHSRDDLITQLAMADFEPGAACPEWLAALALIFNGDQGIIRYVQQLLGYSISGDIGEHILPICYGSGSNGKSTIWNCISELLGDYALVANDDLVLGDRSGHPTELAALYQKRFVPIPEPEHNSKLKESRVKQLTGDDRVTARKVCQDFWTFKRTHKFWLSTNHLPRITGTDEGIWRRVKLIPFTVDLRDKVKPVLDYHARLIELEGPGILNWLIEGFQDWKKNGLVEPQTVKRATAVYRADSDPLGEFLTEFCILEVQAMASAKELFKAYSDAGGRWSKTAFGLAMAERFEKEKPTGGEYRRQTVYLGIRLKTDSDENSEKPCEIENCHQLSPVAPVDLMGMRFSIERMGELVTTGDTSGNGHQKHPPKEPDSRTCQKCSQAMIPGKPIAGFRNWDCPGCGKIDLEKLPVAQVAK